LLPFFVIYDVPVFCSVFSQTKSEELIQPIHSVQTNRQENFTEEFSFFLMEIQARLVLAVVCGGEGKRVKRRKCRSK
jgi:hypothetical protein